jgi:predicted polyphosphate/ATP-dependent NAD kinase
MRHVGVVVNPIAGMGGRVGLKGTDGKVAEARERGAEPRAPDRASTALEALAEHSGEVELYAYGGEMGAEEATDAGFDPTVVGTPEGEETTAADTREAVARFVEAGVDLILFVGGDGTAVDVAKTLEERDAELPILGVPAGVKVYSAVFTVRPRAAGQVAATFTETEAAEVNDIDEDAFRGGEVVTDLVAVVRVPVTDRRQASKQLGGGSVASLAAGFAEDVDASVTFVFGPGSTVGTIQEELGIDGTALGVDVWRDGELLVADGSERAILETLGEENVIVVSPIGGQGFIFGRGNQQLSPAVIEQSSVEVVASRRKLDGLDALRVDTGDPELDDQLRGWMQVRIGRYERRLLKVV